MKLIAFSFILTATAFAGKQSDDVAKKIFEALKADKSSAATHAISDSASPLLKEKIDQKGNFEQLSSQFDVMNRTYGKPISFEVILNKKVGKFEKRDICFILP
jgi:hypothetical protein